MSMLITEQDLFNYVNFPEQLTEDKKEFILRSPQFAEAIEYFTGLRNAVNRDNIVLPETLIELLSSPEADLIFLYPEASSPRQVKHSFAAQSHIYQSPLTARSYISNNKNVLIRIVKQDTEYRIFTFVKANESVENYIMLLHTQEQTFSIDKIEAEVVLELTDFPVHIELSHRKKF